MRPRVPSAVVRPLERGALLALLGFTLVAVAGYWNFALHPERLPDTPGAAGFFAISFGFFAQVHILLAAACLGVVLVGRLGMRWLPAFALVYLLSFTAEHLGTGYGVPFGAYGYGGLLGPKLGGRVPALIPVSWFLMALPARVMAQDAVPDRSRWLLRAVLGAAWMVVWDLSLDPAMSFLTPYWRWESAGPWYGMPLVNLLGWGVTALVLMTALELVSERTGIADLPAGWMARYWAVVLLLPLGMVAAAGLWLAVGATLAMAVAVAGVGRLAGRPLPERVGAPEDEPTGEVRPRMEGAVAAGGTP